MEILGEMDAVMRPFKIYGIGEILWDCLPTGRHLGGAPANFAYHSKVLGGMGGIITRIGKDPLGEEIILRLQEWKVPTDAVQIDPKFPTGTVEVALNSDGQPEYLIAPSVAWENLSLEVSAITAVSEAQAICFGTLAQRTTESCRTIQKLLEHTPVNALRVFDINLRQNFYTAEIIETSLARSNVLKLNDCELPVLAAQFKLKGEPKAQLQTLVSLFNLRSLAYTRGPNGSLIFDQGEWSEHLGIRTKVLDTIGAGDAFTASFVLGLLLKLPLSLINQRANTIASFVCAQRGATPEYDSSFFFNQ